MDTLKRQQTLLEDLSKALRGKDSTKESCKCADTTAQFDHQNNILEKLVTEIRSTPRQSQGCQCEETACALKDHTKRLYELSDQVRASTSSPAQQQGFSDILPELRDILHTFSDFARSFNTKDALTESNKHNALLAELVEVIKNWPTATDNPMVGGQDVGRIIVEHTDIVKQQAKLLKQHDAILSKQQAMFTKLGDLLQGMLHTQNQSYTSEYFCGSPSH